MARRIQMRITVDEDVREEMAKHDGISWSRVAEKAFVKMLVLLDELKAMEDKRWK